MPIVPDDKNWTWVLERPCPECHFDTTTVGRSDVAIILGAVVDAWDDAFRRRTSEELARRPRDDRWSPLEYACHVRDVFRIFDERVALMATGGDPTFANWDQDETAERERYGEQDPAVVSAELVDSGRLLAEHCEALSPECWLLTGTRSDGARFDVERLARYLVHDPVHHLYDVDVSFPPAIARHAATEET